MRKITGWFMLFCCNSTIQGKIYAVADNQSYYNRLVEYALCPVCNKTVLKLTENRYSDNKRFENLYKGRKAKRLLRELKPHLIKHIRRVKHGTKSNQNWVFGETVITRNKKKVYAVDFNGEKKIVT